MHHIEQIENYWNNEFDVWGRVEIRKRLLTAPRVNRWATENMSMSPASTCFSGILLKTVGTPSDKGHRYEKQLIQLITTICVAGFTGNADAGFAL